MKKKLKYATIEVDPPNDPYQDPVEETIYAVNSLIKKSNRFILCFDPICGEVGNEVYPYTGTHLIYVANRQMTREEMDDAFRLHHGVSRETYLDDME